MVGTFASRVAGPSAAIGRTTTGTASFYSALNGIKQAALDLLAQIGTLRALQTKATQ